jgi:hypothetical protein
VISVRISCPGPTAVPGPWGKIGCEVFKKVYSVLFCKCELKKSKLLLVQQLAFQLLENLLVCFGITPIRNIMQLLVIKLIRRDWKFLEHYQPQIVTIDLIKTGKEWCRQDFWISQDI